MATAQDQIQQQKNILYQRLQSIDNDLSGASRAITEAESKVASVDAAMGALPSRLSSIRARGYAAMGHLDKTIELLTKKWADASPLVKQSLANSLQPISPQINNLRSEMSRAKSEIDMSMLSAAQSSLNRLAGDASSIKSRAVSEAARVTAPVGEVMSSLAAVDRDLKIGETTLALFGQAAFPLKQQEFPVLAIEGKNLGQEKTDGTLYFTNQRFVFEGKKEVVLEKKLFIVTKKRVDRVIMAEQPIGALSEISKGRVGLIAGIGVYVKYKPETGLPEAVYDVKGWEADVITRFFSYIIGGEADKDIAATRGLAPSQMPTIKVTRCPYCGAPQGGEIYRGQTTVKCEYCGSQIALT